MIDIHSLILYTINRLVWGIYMKSIEKFIHSLEVLRINLQSEMLSNLKFQQDELSKIVTSNDWSKKEEIDKNLLENEIKICKHSLISNVLRILQIDPSSWNMCGEIFVEFDLLSELLIETKLNMKEQAEIIEYLISKNLAAGVANAKVDYFDIRKLNDFEFKNITYQQAEEFLKTDGYRRLSEKEKKTELETNAFIELQNFINQNMEQRNDITTIHKTIEEDYFNHKDSLTEENITSYIDQLKKLKLSDEVATSLRIFLMKKIKKEKPTLQLKTIKNLKKDVILSKKQYYELESRLKEMLDLDTMTFKREIYSDELQNLFQIMIQLKYDKETIYEVARKYEKMNQQKNAIVLYLEVIDQLRDYISEEEVHNLEEIFQETFICNSEDYIEWKNMLKENLLDQINQIPKDHILKLVK